MQQINNLATPFAVNCARCSRAAFKQRVNPPDNVGDCSYRRLHCEDGAEPGPALRNAFVGLGGPRQWVSLDDGAHFSRAFSFSSDHPHEFQFSRSGGSLGGSKSRTNREQSLRIPCNIVTYDADKKLTKTRSNIWRNQRVGGSLALKE